MLTFDTTAEDFGNLKNFQNLNPVAGQVGDEGWHALKTIPNTWISAAPTGNGAQHYLAAGPGLGAKNPDDDREVLLDKIPDVTPFDIKPPATVPAITLAPAP